MERELAEKIMECLARLSPPLNDLTELSDRLPRKDAVAMRRKLGAIMGSMHEILWPIIKEFPDLDPDRK